MKLRSMVGAAVAACGILASVACATDPTGSWKWIQREPGATGKTPRETVLTLTLTAGRLTGTITMPGRGMTMETKDIIDGWFKEDAITFTVERDVNAVKVVTHYQGKITGDFINGSVRSAGRDGLMVTRPWTARRGV